MDDREWVDGWLPVSVVCAWTHDLDRWAFNCAYRQHPRGGRLRRSGIVSNRPSEPPDIRQFERGTQPHDRYDEISSRHLHPQVADLSEGQPSDQRYVSRSGNRLPHDARYNSTRDLHVYRSVHWTSAGSCGIDRSPFFGLEPEGSFRDPERWSDRIHTPDEPGTRAFPSPSKSRHWYPA